MIIKSFFKIKFHLISFNFIPWFSKNFVLHLFQILSEAKKTQNNFIFNLINLNFIFIIIIFFNFLIIFRFILAKAPSMHSLMIRRFLSFQFIDTKKEIFGRIFPTSIMIISELVKGKNIQ